MLTSKDEGSHNNECVPSNIPCQHSISEAINDEKQTSSYINCWLLREMTAIATSFPSIQIYSDI